MEVLKCKSCQKELTKDMEIEYSGESCDFFCSPYCAINFYFEYMRSTVVDLTDKEFLNYHNIIVKNKKLCLKN